MNLVQDLLYEDQWLSLEEGKSYQMRAMTTDYGGAGHMTVAMEIRSQGQTYEQHPKATRTVTHFAYDPENTFEEWYFTVKDPDDGSFKIRLLNPTVQPPEWWESDEIDSDASASKVQKALRKYYKSNFDYAPIEVTREMLDADGLATEDSDLMVSYKYTVKVTRVIESPSAE